MGMQKFDIKTKIKRSSNDPKDLKRIMGDVKNFANRVKMC